MFINDKLNQDFQQELSRLLDLDFDIPDEHTRHLVKMVTKTSFELGYIKGARKMFEIKDECDKIE